jgi:hypothetical protein
MLKRMRYRGRTQAPEMPALTEQKVERQGCGGRRRSLPSSASRSHVDLSHGRVLVERWGERRPFRLQFSLLPNKLSAHNKVGIQSARYGIFNLPLLPRSGFSVHPDHGHRWAFRRSRSWPCGWQRRARRSRSRCQRCTGSLCVQPDGNREFCDCVRRIRRNLSSNQSHASSLHKRSLGRSGRFCGCFHAGLAPAATILAHSKLKRVPGGYPHWVDSNCDQPDSGEWGWRNRLRAGWDTLHRSRSGGEWSPGGQRPAGQDYQGRGFSILCAIGLTHRNSNL